MPALTRRRDPQRLDCWRVLYDDVHVGTVVRAVGNPNAAESWQWSCGFYPGSNPGEHRNGTAASFEEARAAFEAAWRDYLPKRTEADFHAWRDQRDWTERKHAVWRRGERLPSQTPSSRIAASASTAHLRNPTDDAHTMRLEEDHIWREALSATPSRLLDREQYFCGMKCLDQWIINRG
jgi:hypothetical protein